MLVHFVRSCSQHYTNLYQTLNHCINKVGCCEQLRTKCTSIGGLTIMVAHNMRNWIKSKWWFEQGLTLKHLVRDCCILFGHSGYMEGGLDDTGKFLSLIIWHLALMLVLTWVSSQRCFSSCRFDIAAICCVAHVTIISIFVASSITSSLTLSPQPLVQSPHMREGK